MIWAGDTAQTIAAGSSFKFDELKAFLYRTNVGVPLAEISWFLTLKNRKRSFHLRLIHSTYPQISAHMLG